MTRAGFTLLEVLVALAVLALIGTAIVHLGAVSTASTGAIAGRAQAAVVAENALVDLWLQGGPLTLGETGYTVQNAGVLWDVRQRIERGGDARLLTVAISVRSSDGRAQASVDAYRLAD